MEVTPTKEKQMASDIEFVNTYLAEALGGNTVVEIHVTQDVIEHALSNNRGHCPVARALATDLYEQHQLEARAPKADETAIRFSVWNERFVIATPKPVADRIRKLDAGEGMKPFSFRINLAKAKATEKVGLSPNRIGNPTTAPRSYRQRHNDRGVA